MTDFGLIFVMFGTLQDITGVFKVLEVLETNFSSQVCELCEGHSFFLALAVSSIRTIFSLVPTN